MTRFLLKLAIVGLVFAGYVASPFVTAWSIREAVRSGDSDYLARAIDWPSVRATLKPELSRIALNLPTSTSEPASNPGLWQRIKAYWGQGAINQAIDSYLTPEGLPQLFAMRKAYRDYTGAIDETAGLPVIERMKRFWARVKRAEFTSLSTVEIDLADKTDPNRIFLSKLHLTASGWMLKELRIKLLTTADAEPQRVMGSVRGVPSRPQSWSSGFISRAEAASGPNSPSAGDAVGSDDRLSFWQRASAAAR